jgi:hypothetical protein
VAPGDTVNATLTGLGKVGVAFATPTGDDA